MISAIRLIFRGITEVSMRITVSHNKTREEVTKIVNDSTDQLFRGTPGSPLQIVDYQKSWDGSTMHFSFTGKMGIFTAPLRGTVLVTDKDVTVECELPGLLKSFISPQKLEEGIKSKVRGLLT
jgi:hypothetical protein